MTGPLRVLCLDIEGGHGGSSRSLFHSLKHVDRQYIIPSVWCRRERARDLYDGIQVSVQVEPDLPRASALPKTSRNLWQLAQHALDFRRASTSGTLARLLEAATAHDVVHFNHEAFAGLAFWLRRKLGRPAVMHIRTNVVASPFARAQMRLVSRAVDRVVFITPNEERTFRALGGTCPGQVIFNIAETTAEVRSHPAVPRDGRLVVASLSNAAYVRGTDRLLEIAAAVRALGRRDILFVVAGDMRLSGNEWPGRLKGIARRGGSLVDAARDGGLADSILFLGHVAQPETVLSAADVLVKPTREDNPWGRDVLEAMAAGRPVISNGSDQTFVENDVTGVLCRSFDAAQIARELAALADDRSRLLRLGDAGRMRVTQLCDGVERARELAAIWRTASERIA